MVCKAVTYPPIKYFAGTFCPYYLLFSKISKYDKLNGVVILSVDLAKVLWKIGKLEQ